jgi:hypothetical protein
MNGRLAVNVPVTVRFLSPTTPSSSGSWCQQQGSPVETGHTNAQGQFSFSYNATGPKTAPTLPSFCIMRAVIGKAVIITAIDQTNDPAPYHVRAAPKTMSRLALASNKANVGLTVTKPHSPHPLPVFGDPTAIITEIPSAPGACGSVTPYVKKTKRSKGQAFLVYTPSTVFGTTAHPVTCTVIAQEATTSAKSNKVVITQKKP